MPSPKEGAIAQAMQYGARPDGTPKGAGWLGELKRPDGGVSTELSISFSDVLGGKDIPLLVPTLSPAEVQQVLKGGEPPRSAIDKAIQHAIQREQQGLSPFKD